MNKILSLCLIGLLASCASLGVRYEYDYSVAPQEANIQLTRFLSNSSVELIEIKNFSDTCIRIFWDDLTLVLDSTSTPLSIVSNRGVSFPSTSIILPRTSMYVTVMPSQPLRMEYIRDEYGASLIPKESYKLLPEYDYYRKDIRDHIKSLEGSTITIAVSVDRGNGIELVQFNVVVENIKPDHRVSESTYSFYE